MKAAISITPGTKESRATAEGLREVGRWLVPRSSFRYGLRGLELVSLQRVL